MLVLKLPSTSAWTVPLLREAISTPCTPAAPVWRWTTLAMAAQPAAVVRVKPDFVKIDKYFIRDISDHPENLQMLQAIKGIADVFGTQPLPKASEPTTTCARCATWTSPRPGLAAGAARPWRRARRWTTRPWVMHDRRVAVLPHLGQTARPGILRSLLVVQAPVSAHHHQRRGGRDVPPAHRPARAGGGGRHASVALINRQQFMNHYATLYFREVHGRKVLPGVCQPGRAWWSWTAMDQLVGILTSQDQRYLSDGYIVTDNGRYLAWARATSWCAP